jgi:hypothetical protein
MASDIAVVRPLVAVDDAASSRVDLLVRVVGPPPVLGVFWRDGAGWSSLPEYPVLGPPTAVPLPPATAAPTQSSDPAVAASLAHRFHAFIASPPIGQVVRRSYETVTPRRRPSPLRS